MKKFIFLLVDTESKEVTAVYTDEKIAKKMKPVIEKKLDSILTLEKHQVNPDIKVIN
jgi:hypothetical protein